MMGSSLSGLPYVSNVNKLEYNDFATIGVYVGLMSINHPYYMDGLFNGTIELANVNNNSWGYSAAYGYTNKSPFDPCPAGWRVPPGKDPGTSSSSVAYPWEGFIEIHDDVWFNDEIETEIFMEMFRPNRYGINGLLMDGYGGFYPQAGEKGAEIGINTNIIYWSSSLKSEKEVHVMGYDWGDNNPYYPETYGSSSGLPVRCIAE